MNIVLVSLDCVRPDYIGCYSDKNRTPFLESALDVGVIFENCISQASHTTTSHSSMFTGLYPFNHKVRWVSGSKIHGALIQEVLKEKGFHTAAFIGGWTLTHKAFERGFDRFHKEYSIEDTTEGRHIFNPIDKLVNLAIDHLDQNTKDNNYIFIHSFDAHFTSRSDKEGKRKDRYMEEIRKQDKELNRLYDRLAQDEHLLVITSDHGDKQEGEHGYPYVYNADGEKVGIHFHETELYEVQLRVPFIVFGNRVVRSKVKGLSRTVDIPCTILGHIGASFPEPVDGMDLSGELRGGSEVEHPVYVYSETYHAQLVEENRYAMEMSHKYQWGWRSVDSLVSLRSNDKKLICTANGHIKPAYFFDIKNDPDEEHNLIDDPDHANEIALLEKILNDMIREDDQYKYGSIKDEVKGIKDAIRKGKLKGI
ncbi:MAG: sulfatase [Candidatus Thermoplasmatota archaeon]|nr:sulfatase [Candidatus Thermoplasmatota archaeon]